MALKVNQIKVAVIDDDESARKSLTRLVKAAGIDAIAFPSAREFLEDPVRDQFDCAVTDVRMPGVDGFKLQETLTQTLPHLLLVFITGHGDVPMSVRAMKKGAVDFLEKPVDDSALIDAIRRAAARSRELRTESGELEQLRRKYDVLTPRQREVFALVVAGLLNKQSGAHLNITEKTVKVHRARIMEQMGAASLPDLVRMGTRLGIRLPEADYSAAKGKLDSRTRA